MIKLIKFEILKFLKDKRFIILTIIIGVFSFFSGYSVYFISPSYDKPSGFSMLSGSLNFMSNFLCIFTLLCGSLTFSMEFENGTLHMILLGRYSRNKTILSKILSLYIMSIFLLIVTFLFTIFSGLIFSKFEGIKIQGYVLKKLSSLWFYTILTFLLLSISIYTYSLLGIFLSIIAKNILPSILLAIGIYFLILILSFFPKIQNFFFPYYLNSIVEIFSKITKGIDVSYFPFLYQFFSLNFFYIFTFSFLSTFLFKIMEL